MKEVSRKAGMKEGNPLVSIGMPVYNGAPFLKQALDSLLSQDYKHFELVISDNASTDATPEICRDYASKDPRTKYHRNSSNQGPAANFLQVLNLACGDYFMWAAHDDLWEATFMSTLLAPFQNYDDVVLTCCEYDTVYHVTGRVETHSPLEAALSAENSIFENAVWMITYPHSPFFYGLYAMEPLKQSRFRMRSEPCDFADLFLLNEMSLAGKVHFIPETLFHAGVKGEALAPPSFAKRRLPRFRFAYRTYYTDSLKCIARSKKVTRVQKLYLIQLLTNQVLALMSGHEPIPDLLKRTIQKESRCSTRVADMLLSFFGS
jgi:glycosyltransferase involved in cell wall biosynthesis